MKIVISTCNQLAHLVPNTVGKLYKYWPGSKENIVVLHFDKKPEVGCETYYMGPQGKWGRSWSDPIRDTFMAEFDDEYFCLWLDDYILTEPVDMERLAEMEGWVRDGVQKAILCSRSIANVTCEPFHNGLLKVTQNSKWRSTLQAAIWRTGYFKFYLGYAQDAWDFETENQYRMSGDKASIICTEDGVCQYNNASQIER